MNQINELVESYYSFLREKTIVQTDELSGWTQISTPFLGIFNDSIDLYAKIKNGSPRDGSPRDGTILLSDDGQTLRDLELSGIQISRSPKRKELFSQILFNYGIRQKDKELLTEANENNFPQKKLNLLSAIVEINNLYFLAKHTIASVFVEDVKNFLEEQDLIYTPHFISKGSSGLEFTFDFQMAYRTKEVVKAFNTINKINLPHFLFSWEDIKPIRQKQTGKNVVGLAIINDFDKDLKPEYLEALVNKGADYVLWSDRHSRESLNKLAA